MPLLLHGDAAFAGQGVVSECFALSGLRGYGVGGTMHFIVNNQIGFTTSPEEQPLLALSDGRGPGGRRPRSSTSTATTRGRDLRRQGGHRVPPAVRQGRGASTCSATGRFGHNEGDDPTMTQPLMYAKIKGHPTVRDLYAQRLIGEGVCTQGEFEGWIKEFDAFLDEEFEGGQGLSRQQGRLAGRQVVGPEAALGRRAPRHRGWRSRSCATWAAS
jgi:2-oxoglutarate dehydrogenase E1 component